MQTWSFFRFLPDCFERFLDSLERRGKVAGFAPEVLNPLANSLGLFRWLG
jgi:hypothetical protein